MPTKSVDLFFVKVAEDKALQAKLKALHKQCLKETEASKAKASGAVVKLAAAAGFKFQLKDLALARKAKAKPSRAELAEVTGRSMNCSGRTYDYCTAQNWTCMIGSWY